MPRGHPARAGQHPYDALREIPDGLNIVQGNSISFFVRCYAANSEDPTIASLVGLWPHNPDAVRAVALVKQEGSTPMLVASVFIHWNAHTQTIKATPAEPAEKNDLDLLLFVLQCSCLEWNYKLLLPKGREKLDETVLSNFIISGVGFRLPGVHEGHLGEGSSAARSTNKKSRTGLKGPSSSKQEPFAHVSSTGGLSSADWLRGIFKGLHLLSDTLFWIKRDHAKALSKLEEQRGTLSEELYALEWQRVQTAIAEQKQGELLAEAQKELEQLKRRLAWAEKAAAVTEKQPAQPKAVKVKMESSIEPPQEPFSVHEPRHVDIGVRVSSKAVPAQPCVGSCGGPGELPPAPKKRKLEVLHALTSDDSVNQPPHLSGANAGNNTWEYSTLYHQLKYTMFQMETDEGIVFFQYSPQPPISIFMCADSEKPRLLLSLDVINEGIPGATCCVKLSHQHTFKRKLLVDAPPPTTASDQVFGNSHSVGVQGNSHRPSFGNTISSLRITAGARGGSIAPDSSVPVQLDADATTVVRKFRAAAEAVDKLTQLTAWKACYYSQSALHGAAQNLITVLQHKLLPLVSADTSAGAGAASFGFPSGMAPAQPQAGMLLPGPPAVMAGMQLAANPWLHLVLDVAGMPIQGHVLPNLPPGPLLPNLLHSGLAGNVLPQQLMMPR